jgi:hypothetical protein|tara:strand:- start:48833 stop:49006 length:174 start_codon:yes stop_codon:yes gene_type:complete
MGRLVMVLEQNSVAVPDLGFVAAVAVAVAVAAGNVAVAVAGDSSNPPAFDASQVEID